MTTKWRSGKKKLNRGGKISGCMLRVQWDDAGETRGGIDSMDGVGYKIEGVDMGAGKGGTQCAGERGEGWVSDTVTVG